MCSCRQSLRAMQRLAFTIVNDLHFYLFCHKADQAVTACSLNYHCLLPVVLAVWFLTTFLMQHAKGIFGLWPQGSSQAENHQEQLQQLLQGPVPAPDCSCLFLLPVPRHHRVAKAGRALCRPPAPTPAQAGPPRAGCPGPRPGGF